MNEGNTISFGQDTATIFYQRQPYFTGDKIKVLSYKDRILNETISMYLIATMRKAFGNFSWGSSSFNVNVLKEVEVLLPVNIEKNIDYKYIEEYVREIEEERLIKLKEFLQDAGFQDCILTIQEDNALNRFEHLQFMPIEIGDLLFGEKGDVDIQNKDINGRGLYFINSGVQNFGIKGMTDRKAKVFSPNTITIDFLGNSYYRPYHYVMATHNHVFSMSNDAIKNENVGLFFCASMSYLKRICSFNNMGTLPFYEKSLIMLPKTADGNNVDYDFMETYISAVKKQCIVDLIREIEGRLEGSQIVKGTSADTNVFENHNLNHNNSNIWMAAESFECYKWKSIDRSICDFFGSDKTILVGCYKGKKHLDWILSHQMYTIRLGKVKGSMEANRMLFEKTSVLVLYELGKPNKLSAYKVTAHQEMAKEELVTMNYPNENPRKNYMTFSITPLDMNLNHLADLHLIEKLIEINADNIKGTPVFIEP